MALRCASSNASAIAPLATPGAAACVALSLRGVGRGMRGTNAAGGNALSGRSPAGDGEGDRDAVSSGICRSAPSSGKNAVDDAEAWARRGGVGGALVGRRFDGDVGASHAGCSS